MKKLIAIPLLFLYLTAVSGMMVQIHFCGEVVSSWKVNEKAPSCCCADDQKRSNGESDQQRIAEDSDCCSDKTITLKIAQDQNKVAEAQFSLNVLQLTGPVIFYALPELTRFPAAAPLNVYQANAPPGLWQDIPLYKLHSRFTYYG